MKFLIAVFHVPAIYHLILLEGTGFCFKTAKRYECSSVGKKVLFNIYGYFLYATRERGTEGVRHAG